MKRKRKPRNIPWCGPAVVSLITGESAAVCIDVIRSVRGYFGGGSAYHAPVRGMSPMELTSVFERMGYLTELHGFGGTLEKFIDTLAKENHSRYLVAVENPPHYIIVRKCDEECYVFDNYHPFGVPIKKSSLREKPLVMVFEVKLQNPSKLEKDHPARSMVGE